MDDEYDFTDKDGLLEKLRAYAVDPDDDTIRIKDRIKQMLLSSPELLYALDEKELESELFNPDGTLNKDGEWDLYFGDNANIRPFVFFPDVQTKAKNFVCYTVGFNDSRSSGKYAEKYFKITFTIFVYAKNAMDKLTGIARHDLIAGIIREKFAWSGLTMSDAIPIQEAESTTDTDYICKTLVYQALIPNSIVTTNNGYTKYTNKGKR